jgi:hypothetical protein
MARGGWIFVVGYPYGGMGMGMMGSKSDSNYPRLRWYKSEGGKRLSFFWNLGELVNPYGYGGMPY